MVDTCFSSFPFQTVEKLILGTKHFSAEELFKRMEADYSDDDTLRQTQEMIFCQALPNILGKWEKEAPEKLVQFLQFCTGRTYITLDRMSTSTITVEFKQCSVEGNSTSEDRLPESHTCVSTLSIPSSAYHGDFEVFEAKLTQAVEYYNQFTMR